MGRTKLAIAATRPICVVGASRQRPSRSWGPNIHSDGVGHKDGGAIDQLGWELWEAPLDAASFSTKIPVASIWQPVESRNLLVATASSAGVHGPFNQSRLEARFNKQITGQSRSA